METTETKTNVVSVMATTKTWINAASVLETVPHAWDAMECQTLAWYLTTADCAVVTTQDAAETLMVPSVTSVVPVMVTSKDAYATLDGQETSAKSLSLIAMTPLDRLLLSTVVRTDTAASL